MRFLSTITKLTLIYLLSQNSLAFAKLTISSSPSDDAFPLVSGTSIANIEFSESEEEVIKLAINSFVNDVQRVTGKKPGINKYVNRHIDAKVYVASVNNKHLIETLQNHISTQELQHLTGRWESFLIKTIVKPEPQVDFGLLILGSDRRGTAYGIYELSQAIGVSPWYWWSDVPVKKRDTLFVNAESELFGPPSVKYRGIFINDEDWGLHPWASSTFDPELGDIGPKTYERVFDLILRLKANTLWPAMHKVSGAFNKYPENKKLADRYGIIMGSSHAEPMLRNNVGEWTRPAKDYNYFTHKQAVLNYWETRVQENAKYENIYTLGMRGIHDSGMTAGESKKQKAAMLGQIINDQRQLLSAIVSPKQNEIPQAFTPYKEVLALYRTGMNLPDDVTLVWPDDNHGYIRQFPNELERARAGGSGVYYHLSYLGSPLSYLWLYTTPPALIWQEMNKAYSLGAQQYWIANVGDIKPAELGIEFFLQMAWDIDRWTLQTQQDFIRTWATREFSASYADDIAAVFAQYFALNFQRRPEHLQWWLPHTPVKSSPLTEKVLRQRLAAFTEMASRCLKIKSLLPKGFHTAFFELVEYPVLASTYANQRFFHLEQYERFLPENPSQAKAHALLAHQANDNLKSITEKFNKDIAGGKWNHIMKEEPADNHWRSFRQTRLVLPSKNALSLNNKASNTEPLNFKGNENVENKWLEVTIEAEDYALSQAKSGLKWQRIEGLGRSKDSVGVFPVKPLQIAEKDILSQSPYLEYRFRLKESGDYHLAFKVLPTYSINSHDSLRLAFGLGEEKPTVVSAIRETGSDNWKQEVLSGLVTMHASLHVSKPGEQKLRLYMLEPGIIVDQILVSKAGKPANAGYRARSNVAAHH